VFTLIASAQPLRNNILWQNFLVTSPNQWRLSLWTFIQTRSDITFLFYIVLGVTVYIVHIFFSKKWKIDNTAKNTMDSHLWVVRQKTCSYMNVIHRCGLPMPFDCRLASIQHHIVNVGCCIYHLHWYCNKWTIKSCTTRLYTHTNPHT